MVPQQDVIMHMVRDVSKGATAGSAIPAAACWVPCRWGEAQKGEINRAREGELGALRGGGGGAGAARTASALLGTANHAREQQHQQCLSSD
jgi:hypothetical protein